MAEDDIEDISGMTAREFTARDLLLKWCKSRRVIRVLENRFATRSANSIRCRLDDDFEWGTRLLVLRLADSPDTTVAIDLGMPIFKSVVSEEDIRKFGGNPSEYLESIDVETDSGSFRLFPE